MTTRRRTARPHRAPAPDREADRAGLLQRGGRDERSASRRARRRRTPTRCGRSSAYRDGGRSLPRSGRSRAWTPSPSPTSPRRLCPASGADGNPRLALPRRGSPLLATSVTSLDGRSRVGTSRVDPGQGNGGDDHTGCFAGARTHHRAPPALRAPRRGWRLARLAVRRAGRLRKDDARAPVGGAAGLPRRLVPHEPRLRRRRTARRPVRRAVRVARS